MASPVADSYSAPSGATLYAGRSSGVPAWVQALPTRRWVKLGNGLAAIDPKDDPLINPVYPAAPPWRGTNNTITGIFAYSGGCADPDLPIFYQWGGGHGDSGNNGIYALDGRLALPTWGIERKPAGSIGNWDGVTEYVWDGLDSVQDTYNNGEPRSSHSYNGPTIAEGKMWTTQGYKAGLGGVGGRTLFWWDLTTKAWGSTPMIADGILSQDMCYVPDRRKLYTVGKGNLAMGIYNIPAGTWSQTTAETGTSNQTRLVNVPTKDLVVGISSVVSGGFFVHDLASPKVGGAEPTPGIVGGGSLFDGLTDLCNGIWVASLGAILGWSYGSGFWTLTPPASGPTTNPWTKGTLAADAGNTLTPTGRPGAQDPQTFGRLFNWRIGGFDVIGLSLFEESINTALQPYFFKL